MPAELDTSARPFVEQLRSGALKDAYQTTAPEFQAETSENLFQQAVRLMRVQYGKAEVVQFQGASMPTDCSNTGAYAHYRVEGTAGDLALHLLLVRRPDGWRVRGCTFSPLARHSTIRPGVPAS